MLTHDQIVVIRERAERAAKTGGADGSRMQWYAVRDDIPLLIAEITRLRASLAEIAHYEAPFGLDAMGYEVLRIMAQQALNNGGSTE
ncbi:hypothetical protein [Brevibacillus porteri]|uniref:hypothetical protein n=1 Tax=Brevibacillus porteri TaxID=2126350 RepID=UPI003D1B2E40